MLARSPEMLATMNFGFNATELARVQSLIEMHQDELMEKWNGHSGVAG